MDTTISPAELIRSLPPPEKIRQRLADIAAERKCLMALLRAALATERGSNRTAIRVAPHG
jgi:hypothetical protein